jgi:hypothetical protein
VVISSFSTIAIRHALGQVNQIFPLFGAQIIPNPNQASHLRFLSVNADDALFHGSHERKKDNSASTLVQTKKLLSGHE